MEDEPPRWCSRRVRGRWVTSVVGVWMMLANGPIAAAATHAPDGHLLYRRYCASCHGESGAGNGPDAVFYESRPRDLHEGFLGKYKTEDLIKRIRNGRALQLAIDLPALRARATEVESIVAHLRRLPVLSWRRIEAGWNLYADRCEACHGPFGIPVNELPPGVATPRDLSSPAFQQEMSEAELKQTVQHGRRNMPALVPRLTDAEATQVATFVRLLSPGFELYTRHCAACHGDDGRGAGSFGEATQLPTVVFDRAYFSRRDPEEIRDAVWHMLGDHKPTMPHFRRALSEAEARAIVEFLKRTEPKAK